MHQNEKRNISELRETFCSQFCWFV